MNMKNLGIKMRLTDETLNEIREFLDDGMTVRNIARYLGISETAIRYNFFLNEKKKIIKSNDIWHKKNRERILEKMRQYSRKLKQ